VPGYVEDELRGYLECGILCCGFARAQCAGCGAGFVVAFTCKRRGVCPSCNGRHMAQTAANHHVHLHACVTDGVFMPPTDNAGCDAATAFLPARPITPADLAALTERVRRRVIRWFRRKGLLDAAAAAADMRIWENSGFSVDASVRITLFDRGGSAIDRTIPSEDFLPKVQMTQKKPPGLPVHQSSMNLVFDERHHHGEAHEPGGDLEIHRHHPPHCAAAGHLNARRFGRAALRARSSLSRGRVR
jgi:hypothetical protein